MVAPILEILALFVLPVLINKTTEDRFHRIKPYLREVWFVVTGLYVTLMILRPENERYFMVLKKSFGASHPVASYVLVALCGAALFIGYWWFLGSVLSPDVNAAESHQSGEPKKPDVQQSSQGANSPNTTIIGNNNTVNNISVSKAAPILVGPTFKDIPDSGVYCSLGANGLTSGTLMDNLRHSPWKPFSFTEFPNFELVTIRVQGNKLFVNANIGKNILGGSLIEIKDNKYTIHDPSLDKNSNDAALEVVDPKATPIFQLIRKDDNHIILNGYFPLPNGGIIVAGPEGATTYPPGKTVLQISLKPIFKYPAWKHPGEYAD